MVGRGRRLLEDNHEAFYADDPPIRLRACAYLHNYHFRPDDVLLSELFRDTLATMNGPND